jgi:hypothetical protein
MRPNQLGYSFLNPILWGTFILYIILSGFIIAHHELWGDEIHSWNIAKASNSFSDLIYNTRYEGHPPLWYFILWIISKFSHNVAYIQMVHVIIADLTVFLILFFPPFPLITRTLIPFGYYFLYEYAAISRNYAIALLLIFFLCIIIHKNFKHKIILYYILLFLISNTHLVALLLAISIHLYFLLIKMEQKGKRKQVILHALGGGVVFLSALYFIIPPGDSEMNFHFFINRWNVHQITAVIQLPLRAFIPIPAWWNDHLWNTEFLQEAKSKFGLLKFINPLILLMIIGVVFFILRKSKKSIILFISNISLSFIVTITIFPLTTARYSGFIFIGFIVSYWLSFYETLGNGRTRWLVNTLLILQIIGGIFIVQKDIRLPFSNANKINELLKEVPPNEKIVTDYWALNTISAFTDKPFYCIDMQKEMSFILWGRDIVEMQKRPNRYCDGINNYFKKEKVRKLYMVSTGVLQSLSAVDSKLLTSFQIVLVDKREGAIEKGGNLYLYQISSISP